MRGRAAASWWNRSSNVISPNGSWKNTADRPTAAIDARDGGGDRHAVPTPHRVDSDASATATTVAVLSCSNSRDDERAEVGQRRLRPVDRRHAIARLPVAQADEVEAGALEHARVIAERELLHPLQDEQLDLGDLREVDERRGVLRRASSWNRHPVDDVLDHHLDGEAVAGGVRAEPDAMAEHVRRQILDVLGIHLVAVAVRAAPTPWRAGPSR